MATLILGSDEWDEEDADVEVSISEEDDHLELSLTDDAEVSLIPWFLVETDLLPEAFMMSMGCIVPYFFESILSEAGVDYGYAEVEGMPGDEEREYTSSVQFYLRHKDLHGLFFQFRKTGAFGLYDVFFELEDRRVLYGHDERLLFEGFDREEIEAAAARFADAVTEAGE